MSPFEKQTDPLQAPPPPPNPGVSAAASLNSELTQEQGLFSASTVLTGGQGAPVRSGTTAGSAGSASSVLSGRA